MTRTKVTLLLLACIVVGFAFGWLLQSFLYKSPVSPVTEAPGTYAPPPLKKRALNGFCCITPGNPCSDSENPPACFTAKGMAFHPDQAKCDYFCLNVGKP